MFSKLYVVFEKYCTNVAKSNDSAAEKGGGVVGFSVITEYSAIKIPDGFVAV